MVPYKLRVIRELNRWYTFVLKLTGYYTPNASKVFLFHDIVDNISDVKSPFTISLNSFKRFLLFQISIGNHSITFIELTNMILQKEKKRNNTFIVTFDDANESVYSKAYPFLKLYNIPFIVFITKELIGKPDFLSKEQIIELSKDNLCTIASHGCHHSMFRYLSEQEVENELIESKFFLQKLLNKPVECFAFPYGRFVECSLKNVKQLKRSDYLFSFSAIAGTLKQSWFSSLYFLPRINVDERLVLKVKRK